MSKDTTILSALMLGAIVLVILNKRGLIGIKDEQKSGAIGGIFGKVLCTCNNPITGQPENHGWMSKKDCGNTCGIVFISKY